MISINHIPLLNGKPIFLDVKTKEKISAVIKILEQAIDCSPLEIPRWQITEVFSENPRVGMAVYDVLLSYFFSFQSLKINPCITPEDLRCKLYAFLSQRDQSFISRDQRSEILLNFANFQKLSVEEVEKILFADHQAFRKLKLLQNPSLSSVISLYNYDLLDALLRISFAVKLKFSSQLPGSLIKKLFFLSKKFGVLVEFKRLEPENLLDSPVQCMFVGPNELVGRSTKYGKQLSILFFHIYSFLKKETVNFDLEVNYELFGRSRLFKCQNRDLPTFEPPINYQAKESDSFDSDVEKQFFMRMKGLRGWAIEREPDIIILEDGRIIIPDFKLSKRHFFWFLEVVGFWTEDYIRKKIDRYKELHELNANFPIILLVDNKLTFPADIGFPLFFYDKKKFPIPRLLNFLDQVTEAESKQHLEQMIQTADEKLNSIIKTSEKDFLSLKELKESFKVIDNQQLREILAHLKNISFFQEINWVFIPNYGIVSENFLNRLNKRITDIFSVTQKTELPLTKIVDPLSEQLTDQKLLLALLTYLGFKISWKSLSEQVISIT